MTTLPCNCAFTSFNPCSCSNFPVIPANPQQIFSGNGSPVGNIFPVATTAIYLQQDSIPPGIIWEYYQGAWH